jgi:hypothetical protein
VSLEAPPLTADAAVVLGFTGVRLRKLPPRDCRFDHFDRDLLYAQVIGVHGGLILLPLRCPQGHRASPLVREAYVTQKLVERHAFSGAGFFIGVSYRLR